jgi:hypothetical protein
MFKAKTETNGQETKGMLLVPRSRFKLLEPMTPSSWDNMHKVYVDPRVNMKASK